MLFLQGYLNFPSRDVRNTHGYSREVEKTIAEANQITDQEKSSLNLAVWGGKEMKMLNGEGIGKCS